jgi:hypothetical protein
MSDNKPKIDLKARLGKKTMSTPGAASIPPPMATQPTGGIPRPQAAPVQRAPSAMPRPVSPSGVPAPPFQSPSQVPRADPTNPYASMPRQSAPVQGRPTEIRVDMEEVRAAQRSGRGRVMVLALVTAIVGGVVGFAFGGGAERDKGAKAAISGAQELVKDIEDSNKQIQDLSDTVKSAQTKLLNKGTYPQEEVTKLGAINIPFRTASLADKSIGRFKREILSMLIDYASSVEAMNDQKETLQRFLGSQTLKDLIAEQQKPKVRWYATVSNGPSGPWVNLDTLDAPFLVQSDEKIKDKDGKEKPYAWPDDIEIKDGKDTTKMKRYTSGDPGGSSPPYIAVNPQTQSAVCQSGVIGSLVSQLIKMQTVLQGDPTPGVDKTGLIEKGQKLADQLKKIGKS